MPSLQRLVGGLLVVTVVVSIGLPIIGVGSFHATDMIGTMPPWSEQTSYDFRADNTLVSDTVNAVVPMRASFRDRVWEGDLPLWNPLLGSGEPLAVLPNVGTFSPLTLPYLVAPLWLAPVLTKLLEVAVAIAGMYLLARRWRLSRAAALVGALAFVNSAFLVVWTNWPQSHVGALVPFVFWAVERGATAERHWAVWPLAPVVTIMWLEGFPAVTAYALVTAGLYAVVRVAAVHGRGRRAIGRLVALAGSVALSVGLAAIQLLPFLQFLRSLGLDYRQAVAGRHLDWEFLATAVVPDALGSPTDRIYYGPLNYVEGQSWIGVVTLVLIVLLVAGRRLLDPPRGVLPFLVSVGFVGVVIVYFGTPLLDLVGRVPLLGMNFIGRYRAVLGVVFAAGAALGYEVFLGAFTQQSGVRRTALWGSLMGLAMAPLAWATMSEAAEAGHLVYAAMQSALPFLVGVLATAVVASRLRERPPRPAHVLALAVGVGVPLAGLSIAVVVLGVDPDMLRAGARSVGVGVVVGVLVVLLLTALAVRTQRKGALAFGAVALPLLLAAESIAFAHPWWARSPTELFYPPTAAHAFLQENLGQDRFAAAGSTLYPGTNAVYGLRSVTAHAFMPVSYREYLRAIEPDAFARSTTFPFLSNSAETATSPLLDRAAARYWAAGPLDPLYGAPMPAITGDLPLRLGVGDEIVAPIGAGMVRGVTFTYRGATGIAGLPSIVAEVRSATGDVVASGSTRLHHWVRPGPLPVALGEIAVPADSELVVRLEGGVGGEVELASDGIRPSYSRTAPTTDGLELVHTAGAVLYARTDALSRIRWAGRAIVVPDGAARLSELAAGVEEDVVVLGDHGVADAEPSEAGIDVVEDSGDAIRVEVEADSPGFVVIADGIQSGWRAQLDGEDVPLLAADHAFGAVGVPTGRHEVLLWYDPPGWSAGQLVTLVSVAVLLLLAILDRRTVLLVRFEHAEGGDGQGIAPPSRQDE